MATVASFFRLRPPRPVQRTPGIAAAVVEHETPIAPSASSRRRFVCSAVWCHQPPRDKTLSSDPYVQLGTDGSLTRRVVSPTAAGYDFLVRPLGPNKHGQINCAGQPRGAPVPSPGLSSVPPGLRLLLSSMRPRLHLRLLHAEDLSAPPCGVTNRRGIRPCHTRTDH